MTKLKGKVALITGSGRGIGRAIALKLASEGAKVVVNDLGGAPDGGGSDRTAAEQVVDEIAAMGGEALANADDVSDWDGGQALIKAAVDSFGRLDILVNNAAVRAETPFGEIRLEDWRRVLSIVLDGAFLCTQAALPHLVKAGGGTIINIGGLTAHKGADGRAHVITAKAGLAGLTRALALDLAPHHITVNCVVPGTIETMRGVPGAPERPQHRRSLPPVGRRGEPEEIAAMVRTLCGPDMRYVTGQTIHVNGGNLMP
jgi:3-oxoacyl-[acyl-carrier protein] reductase